MQSMGEFLRSIRIGRGLTLQQVAAETRISQTFLEALEEDRMEVFQGETSAKGFARAYGHCLGLLEEEIMGYFSRGPQHYFREKIDIQDGHKRKVEEELKWHVRKGQLVQVVIVVLMGLAVFAVVRMNSDRPVISRVPEVKESQPISVPETVRLPLTGIDQNTDLPAVNKPWLSENLSPLRSPSGVVAVPGPSVGRSEASSDVAGLSGQANEIGNTKGELTLTLVAVEESWVLAELDGEVSREVILRPGEKLTWKANEEFRLTLGNAGGIKAELNGKELPSFGRSGQVVKDILLKAE